MCRADRLHISIVSKFWEPQRLGALKVWSVRGLLCLMIHFGTVHVVLATIVAFSVVPSSFTLLIFDATFVMQLRTRNYMMSNTSSAQ